MTDILSMQIPIWGLLLYMLFMAAVQSLPRPKEGAAPWYVWFYATLHLFAINLKLFFNPRNRPDNGQTK